MRPIAALALGGAILTASCVLVSAAPTSASERTTAAVSPYLPSPPLGPPRRLVFYGNVATLGRAAGRWILRVDPAAFLSGVTAQRAAMEDGAIGPGEPVPNDYYVRNESKRLLTYVVAPAARVTVITKGIHATRVSVGELAALIHGKNPRRRSLFGSATMSYWVQVRGDTVLSMDQQYRP
jgi:hypothetical protein